MPYPMTGEKAVERIVQAVRELWEGRSNAVGQFTCTPNAASTVVTAPNCSPSSEVFLQEITSAAATERGAGGCYVSAKAKGAFTVVHANSAATGRTFAYRIGS